MQTQNLTWALEQRTSINYSDCGAILYTAQIHQASLLAPNSNFRDQGACNLISLELLVPAFGTRLLRQFPSITFPLFHPVPDESPEGSGHRQLNDVSGTQREHLP